MSNTIIYNDGELELKVSIENETVWLTQKQLGDLFDVEVNTINYHIKNIFKQKELDKNPTIRKIRIVQKEGNREVERDVEHYNLDMAISLGYRVNSITATKFRKWATSVLKRYIQNGYSINTQKITNERFVSLENEVIDLKSKIVKIDSLIKNNTLELKQGIFYNGQIFDAYVFISDLIKNSKKLIILIDNYIDDSTLTLFSKNLDINILIYTQTISKKLKLDLEKYNKQYKNLNVKTTKNFHDRFMVIDNEKVFHIGASLKDLGSKTFAFTQINLNHEDILDNL